MSLFRNHLFGLGLTVAIALATLFASPVAAQQRPLAPYGYIVAYGAKDGSLLSDGKQFRIAVVTRNFAEASRTFNYYNSFHMYRAFMMDLKTEADYRAALALQRDPNTGKPSTSKPPTTRPEVGKVAGTRYQFTSTTFTFNANGTVTTNFGGSGRWSQDGKTVTWSMGDGGFVFRYTGTLSATGDTMSVTTVTYNPRSGNEGKPFNYGTGRRLP